MNVPPKAALVIDALPGIGGAEKVLMDAAELFPGAPVYTLLYNREAFRGTKLAGRTVITSFIDRMPLSSTQYRKYLPLMLLAIRLFDLREYDLVLSLNYAVAHGVRVREGQKHLSYTLTPMRYAWTNIGLDGSERAPRCFLGCLFGLFRKWDRTAVRRVDTFASVSHWIAERAEHAYGRTSSVIYPPVDVGRFSPSCQRDGYYITVSRLVPHKRIDMIVKAFNCLRLPLLIVGEGPERARLERIAGTNVRFLGFQPDEEVADLLSRARGYISAAEEDFGIAVVEAQAAGCPVIAFRKGGALETVVEGKTGIFFDQLSAESLAEAVGCFERRRRSFHSGEIAASVQGFNRDRFLMEFARFSSVRGGW